MTKSLFKITPISPEGALELVKEVFPEDRVLQDHIERRILWQRIRREYRRRLRDRKGECEQIVSELSEMYDYSEGRIRDIIGNRKT